MTVIRHIHQKPQKCKWSSCKSYYVGREYPNKAIDALFILVLSGKEKEDKIGVFRRFMKEDNDDKVREE